MNSNRAMPTKDSKRFARTFAVRIVLGGLLAAESGCWTLPQQCTGSSEVAQKALNFRPPPGQAGVYLVRTYRFIAHLIPIDTTLDYQEFGSLKVESYLYTTVNPGEHVIRVPTTPGENYIPAATTTGLPFQAEA